MATLVSAGISVTVTDESFFIPVSAPTVPLFFIATQDEKTQPDVNESPPPTNPVTGLPAQGTFESGVIRTVTSLKQSVELYGIPNFLEDITTGAPHHGDARNEYGVFALNQYLGIGNKAYVIRANVNLNDDLTSLRSLFDNKMQQAKTVLEILVQDFINEKDATAGNPTGTTLTVTAAELLTLANTATDSLFKSYSFIDLETNYFGTIAASSLPVYPSGYSFPPVPPVYDGFQFISANLASYPSFPGGGTNAGEFTPVESGGFLIAAADQTKITLEFLNDTSLGANDAARRTEIVTALQATVNSNTDIRAESFDYNLILCPGYPELADELVALAVDMQEEALVISDTPMDLDADGISNPGSGWAATINRVRSNHIAYYYPSAFASNLDGKNVAIAASGVALRTYTFNDNVAFLWFAPAGLRRGLITGVSDIGYITGTLGTPTTFTSLAMNPGERDALYQYASGGDINPLVFFPGQGFVVWGQKMSTPAASALDRVNVSRLIKYIKRQLRKNTLSFVFEPNDALTRANIKAVVDNFLGDLIVKRGLFDFVTVCDESNNTPDRIDRNELYVDIAIKPVKAAEFIFIPIRVVATGAQI